MPEMGWKSVSIHEDLYKQIEEIIKERPGLYTSVADFVRDACGRRFDELAERAQRKSAQEH